MFVTFATRAGVFALLAALAAGCGSAAPGHSAAPKPVAAAHSAAPKPSPTMHAPAEPTVVHHRRHHHHPRHMHAQVSAPPAQPVNPIPQGNGGDQDGDNNGGPSDGDGNI